MSNVDAHLARGCRLEKSGRRRLVQAAEAELEKARAQERGLLILAHRDEHRHGIGKQTTRRKSNGFRRGTVQPLCVVDGDEERCFLRV